MSRLWLLFDHKGGTQCTIVRLKYNGADPGFFVAFVQATRICYVQAESGDDLLLRVLPGFPRATASSLNDLMLLNFGNAHLGWEDYQANLTNFAHYIR